MYGTSAQREPAKSSGFVEDVDIYNIGLLIKAERGLATVQRGIYSIDDFQKKCGGYLSGYYGYHVARSFFRTLEAGVNVEMKVAMWLASDAVQATAILYDTHGTPVKIFDISCAYRGAVDKSAFGNKVGYKISTSENVTYKLTADTGATPTVAYLDQVNNLEVGYAFKIADGTNTEYAFITAIDPVTRKITFGALTNTYTAALTTVSRLDWNLYIAVKDAKGVFQQKEVWEDMPFAQSNTIGMAKRVNDPVDGSEYVSLAVNASNAHTASVMRPAAVTTWTALASGADGTAPVDANWLTLAAYFADEPMQICLAPESVSSTHNNNIATYATNGTKFMYYGQSSNQASEATLLNLGAICREPVKFGMFPMDKWIETDDPTKDGAKISIPPVGYAAAHWFTSYAIKGASEVAAGNETPLATSDRLVDDNGLVHDDIGGRGDRMITKASVNIARYRQGKGITINSARTMSTDSGYQWQHQIMQFLLIKKSLLAYFRKEEQKKGGVPSQERHRNNVFSYMKAKYDAGEFYHGQKSDGSFTKFEDVVQIINDFSVNTLADLKNGREINFVQFVEGPIVESPTIQLASAGVTTVRG